MLNQTEFVNRFVNDRLSYGSAFENPPNKFGRQSLISHAISMYEIYKSCGRHLHLMLGDTTIYKVQKISNFNSAGAISRYTKKLENDGYVIFSINLNLFDNSDFTTLTNTERSLILQEHIHYLKTSTCKPIAIVFDYYKQNKTRLKSVFDIVEHNSNYLNLSEDDIVIIHDEKGIVIPF